MMWAGRGRTVVGGVAAALLVGSGAAAGDAAGSPSVNGSGGVTSRVSVGTGGAQGDSDSFSSAISANGRYVAFTSNSSDLVAGDTNDWGDVFVRDRATGVTRRVSVGPGGIQANSYSFEPSISANGRYVAFESPATNLVVGDTNGTTDVFVRDRSARVTTRVSVGPGGAQADDSSFVPAISADGRHVAFESLAPLVAADTNGETDVFVRDLSTGVTRRVSVGPGGTEANSFSSSPTISAHGRYVAFESWADNLVAADTNERRDVFVRDRSAQVTLRVSVGTGGAQADSSSAFPAISADGRHVAFESFGSNLVAGDTNNSSDVFVRDWSAQVTRRVSVGTGGAQADGGSFDSAISPHGRYVAFSSSASNLVAGDTNNRADVFLRDRSAQVTRRVSVGPGGAQANGGSAVPAMSADSRHIAFHSSASNLVAGDTNNSLDIFVHELFG